MCARSDGSAVPKKDTVRRTIDQPGRVEAFEETPMYAKIAGYVRINLGAPDGELEEAGRRIARYAESLSG